MSGWGWMVLGVAMLLNGLVFGQLAYLEIVVRASPSLPPVAAVPFDAASAGQIVAVLLLFGQGGGRPAPPTAVGRRDRSR